MLSDEARHDADKITPRLSFNTAEDFFDFTIDGVDVSLDIAEVHQRLVALDVKFRDDSWTCFPCVRDFHPSDLTKPCCPECGEAEKIERDPRWLDELSDYIVSKGVRRCGRDKAGRLYAAILRHIESLKKTADSLPE